MQSSNGYRRFKSRLDYFLTDKEFVDVIVKNKELLKGNDVIFAGVTAKKHPVLSKRTNSADSRILVVAHLRKTIYVAFMKDMYEEVAEYMRYVLREGAINGVDANRLVGEHNVNMKANDILLLSKRKELVSHIMEQIFQKLESERSTIELLKKINDKLGLKIENNLINDALPFLEVRHILVHSDGKPNQDFKRKYPTIKLDAKGKVELNARFVESAYSSINSLLLAMDQAMIESGYISKSELQSKKPREAIKA